MRRRLLFAAGTIVCAAVALVYVVVAGRAPAPAATPKPPAQLLPAAAPATSPVTSRLLAAPDVRGRKLLFVDLDRNNVKNFGGVAVAPLANPEARRVLPGLRCERVYFAAGHGLCLAKGGAFGTLYSAKILDASFKVHGSVPIDGVPSRTRVSPDGRYGSTTTFVSGHSYADHGKFSTQTLLIDLVRGKTIANLERFVVTNHGERIDAPDVNFWGVTFARDSNRFYATLATGSKTYLIEGNVARRTARVLHENVECPSLSPDGTRIAYKKRVEFAPRSPKIWHLYVLDLRTMHETALAEEHAIDDQAEWLGNDLVVYGYGEEVWAVPADGSGAAQRVLTGATSPAALA
jgi:hypothetical protein